jgi:hypothetical protein
MTAHFTVRKAYPVFNGSADRRFSGEPDYVTPAAALDDFHVGHNALCVIFTVYPIYCSDNYFTKAFLKKCTSPILPARDMVFLVILFNIRRFKRLLRK